MSLFKHIGTFIHSRWTNRVLLSATVFFVARYMHKITDLDAIGKIHLSPVWVTAAVAAYLGYLIYYSILWYILTLKNNNNLPFGQTLAVWMYSIFGKYLPLKILGLAYRIAVYKKQTSAPASFITQLCYAEMLSSIIGGSLFSMLLLAVSSSGSALLSSNKLYTQMAITALLLLFFLPAVQKKTFELALKLMGRKLTEFHFNNNTALGMVIGYGFGWILPGLSLFALARAMNPELAVSMLIPIIVLNTIASISGVISIFAPCGIGVREGILLIGLSTMLPGTQAAALTIISRLVTSGMEMAGIGASFLYLEKHDIGISIKSVKPEQEPKDL